MFLKSNIYYLFFLFSFIIIKTNAQFAYTDIIEKSKSINFTEKKVDSILTSITEKNIEYAQIAHNFSFFLYRKKKKL